MVNIDDAILEFISVKYNYNKAQEILRGFELLELFGVNFYDDKYVSLIMSESYIDVSESADVFIQYLISDLNSVINEHHIWLKEESSLFDVLEVAGALYIMQSLEDYAFIESICYSEQSDLDKVVVILSYVSSLEAAYLYNVVDRVDNVFMDALKSLIKDVQNETVSVDLDHLKEIKTFKMFIGQTKSLGFTLYAEGYIREDMTLNEILNVLPFSFDEYTVNGLNGSRASLALDVLTLLIFSKDGYKEPINVIENNYDALFSTQEFKSVIPIISKMYMDYCSFREVVKNNNKVVK